MIHIVVVVFTLTGFVLLHMAMVRHQRDWLGRTLTASRTRVLRLTGLSALALALVAAAMRFGWGHGAVIWFGWLSVAAALVVAACTNRERILSKVRR